MAHICEIKSGSWGLGNSFLQKSNFAHSKLKILNFSLRILVHRGGILKEEKTLEGIGFKFKATPDFN